MKDISRLFRFSTRFDNKYQAEKNQNNKSFNSANKTGLADNRIGACQTFCQIT